MTTVLLVDDEKLIQRSLEKTLLRAGFDVLTAPDCKTGSEVFAQNAGAVDIAVLDLNMPGFDGWATLEHLLAAEGEAEDDAAGHGRGEEGGVAAFDLGLALGEGEEDRDVADRVHDHEHRHEGGGEQGQVERDRRHGRVRTGGIA